MTRDEIIEIATKVYGECKWHESALQHLQIFAQLIAEKEREGCVKRANIALLGTLTTTTDRVLKAIRTRVQE